MLKKPSLVSAGALPFTPVIFTLQQSARWDSTGYPIFVRRQPKQEPTVIHEHVYHEIVFVESGTAEHLSAEGTRRLHAGDVLVLKPRIWHQYLSTSRFGVINCLFDRRILSHQKAFLSLLGGAFDLFIKPPKHAVSTPPAFFHASPHLRKDFLHLLNAMIRERKEKREQWEGAMVVHLMSLIVAIARLDTGEPVGQPEELTHGARDFANEVVIYLEMNFRQKITLDELSRHFHVSASYLSRIFTRRMGVGIISYINHLRIEAACELLRSSDWPVTRIATEVGYDEVAYFFRRFRKEIGMSPQVYRQQQF